METVINTRLPPGLSNCNPCDVKYLIFKFTFFIFISGKYKHNVNCVVNYLMDETCAEMKFSCKKIFIKNKDKKNCSKGDTLVISTENEEKL